MDVVVQEKEPNPFHLLDIRASREVWAGGGQEPETHGIRDAVEPKGQSKPLILKYAHCIWCSEQGSWCC